MIISPDAFKPHRVTLFAVQKIYILSGSFVLACPLVLISYRLASVVISIVRSISDRDRRSKSFVKSKAKQLKQQKRKLCVLLARSRAHLLFVQLFSSLFFFQGKKKGVNGRDTAPWRVASYHIECIVSYPLFSSFQYREKKKRKDSTEHAQQHAQAPRRRPLQRRYSTRSRAAATGFSPTRA